MRGLVPAHQPSELGVPRRYTQEVPRRQPVPLGPYSPRPILRCSNILEIILLLLRGVSFSR